MMQTGFSSWLREKQGRPVDNLDSSEIGFYADQYASEKLQESMGHQINTKQDQIAVERETQALPLIDDDHVSSVDMGGVDVDRLLQSARARIHEDGGASDVVLELSKASMSYDIYVTVSAAVELGAHMERRKQQTADALSELAENDADEIVNNLTTKEPT